MYAPPEDRDHPLLADLARLGAVRPQPARSAFASQLAVAHADADACLPRRQRPAAAAGGLQRVSRLREIALG